MKRILLLSAIVFIGLQSGFAQEITEEVTEESQKSSRTISLHLIWIGVFM